MTELRTVRPEDIESLYAICLATGNHGSDASALYKDDRMLGHIYAAPYAELQPELCFVLADADGVAGFVVGTIDTRAFEADLETRWWPHLRRQYPDPGPIPDLTWNADVGRAYMIHHPAPVRDDIVAEYPAHMHMNLLPRLQGQGLGRKLFNHWIAAAKERGAKGVHVGVSPQNLRAIAFWQRCGLSRLQLTTTEPRPPVWLGARL